MRYIRNLALALAAAALLAMPARAANTYTIVQNQSQLNLTVGGSFLGGALTATEQQPNAITRYNGTIATDFYGSPAPGGSIAFPGGSAANAVNPTGGFLNQPLQYAPSTPGGGILDTAPANYGVVLSAAVDFELPDIDIPIGDTTFNPSILGTPQSIDLKMAVRDLQLDVTGGPSSIGAGGIFDPTSTSLSIASGFADVRGALVFNAGNALTKGVIVAALTALINSVPELATLGITVTTPNLFSPLYEIGLNTRLDLAGLSGAAIPNMAGGDGTLSYVDEFTLSTLTLPVDIALPGLAELGGILDLELGLAGTLVATGYATEVVVPEPSSLVLGAIAASAIGLVIRRRRRSA